VPMFWTYTRDRENLHEVLLDRRKKLLEDD